jgi:hypothetical protein
MQDRTGQTSHTIVTEWLMLNSIATSQDEEERLNWRALIRAEGQGGDIKAWRLWIPARRVRQ